MEFIVEDGTGLSDACSFVSVAYADDYFQLRGNTNWSNLSDFVKEQCLVKATDYINIRYKYKSQILQEEQALEFPRKNIGLPIKVKNACCEYAVRTIDETLAPDLTRDESGLQFTSKKEVIGPIEETYGVSGNGNLNSIQKFKDYPIPDQMLQAYRNTRSGAVYR